MRGRAAQPVAADPKESLPRPGRGGAIAPPRRIIVSRYVLRRLYSTFAGGWPGIGLLVMRLVVGAVLLWNAGPMLWGDPSHMTLASAPLAMLGLLLVAGLWTPVVGAVVAVIQISQILRRRRTSIGRPVGRNHCCRSGDARTGPLVRRRPALRMEAHRPASAPEVVRVGRARQHHDPKGSPQAPPQVVSRHPGE